MDWLRLWHDMPTDPKWRTISKKSGQSISNIIAVYSMMLVCASKSDKRGTLENWNSEDVAAALDLETKDIDDIYKAMQSKVLDGDKLTGWEKRQPDDPTGYQRVRRYRESQKESVTVCNGEKRLVTPDKIRKEQTIIEQTRKEKETPLPIEKPKDHPAPANKDLFSPEYNLFSQACAKFGEDPEELGLTDGRKRILRDIRGNRLLGAEKFIAACEARSRAGPETMGRISVTFFLDDPDKYQEKITSWAAKVKYGTGKPKRGGILSANVGDDAPIPIRSCGDS